jgi:hypothetical protein
LEHHLALTIRAGCGDRVILHDRTPEALPEKIKALLDNAAVIIYQSFI